MRCNRVNARRSGCGEDAVMKKLSLLIFPIISIILEALPIGVSIEFSKGPGITVERTFSYFSPVPPGYACFAPFLTAILTVVLLLIAIISFKFEKLKKTLFLLAVVTAVISVLPVIMGGYTKEGVVISGLLVGECVLARLSGET